jgi:Holliday junction resolvase RusA-like endonuclease
MDTGKNTAAWRNAVAIEAVRAMKGRAPVVANVPLRVLYEFGFMRPKGHYGTGKRTGVLREWAPDWVTVRPDLTKLVRAAEDACTGIVWANDACVVMQECGKFYVEQNPGMHIYVWGLEE